MLKLRRRHITFAESLLADERMGVYLNISKRSQSMSLVRKNFTVSPVVGAFALILSAGALAQSGSANTTMPAAATRAASGVSMSSADQAFVKKAAMGGMAEVAAGQLAQQKAASDQVKSYGTQLVTDHTKANDELKQMAGGKGMDVPAAPDAAHQKAMAKMEGLSGTQFDRAFKMQMVADHQKTIALFKHESTAGKDADLKAFAAKTLPSLQDHLKMAQALK